MSFRLLGYLHCAFKVLVGHEIDVLLVWLPVNVLVFSLEILNEFCCGDHGGNFPQPVLVVSPVYSLGAIVTLLYPALCRVQFGFVSLHEVDGGIYDGDLAG